MKQKRVLQKIITFMLVCTFILTATQTVSASKTSTTEKKASVKFTKTKATGFTSISSMRSTNQYLIAFGEKKSGNVLSYSSDGTTFKDIDLDAAIEKAYKGNSISSIQFNDYLSYINGRSAYCVMGTATAKDKTEYHFLLNISSDMKKVSVLKLDQAIEDLDKGAKNIEIEMYFDYDYDSGIVIVNGSYEDASGTKTPVYLVIKKNSDVKAYKTPNVNCDRVDMAGKYLICYNYQLSLTSDWSQSSVGYFFYSKDYKTWKKGKTPAVDGVNGWNHDYYDWESFCASPQSSSDTYTLYYTSNMKDYKSISKDYVIQSDSRNMNFDKVDNKIYAVERTYGDKGQLVISVKSGKKWKQLFNYKAKSSDFNYIEERWIADGLVILKDGKTKKLMQYGAGKEYSTKLDESKLNLSGTDSDNMCFGTYDSKYLLASKNGLAKYYLFKTPIKIKGTSTWSGKKTEERFYVYSGTAIYYVNKSAVTKAMK
ncbi:MAG: hypothetical protein ACERKN_18515 [Velocimicrobium sp.]